GADRSKGHQHAFGNPHYMLDPLNAGIAARNIRDALIRVDPGRKATYLKRYASLMNRLRNLTLREARLFRPYRGLKVAVYHKEFSYLAHRFGFEAAYSIEEKPGVPPSAPYLEEVVRGMRRDRVRLILIAPWNNQRYAQTLARRS